MGPVDRIDVLDDGFVRLDDAMADDLSVVNAARVSFGVRKEVMEERDEGLIRFLMRESHGTPFEHNAFRFHVRCPIFVAREWFRHRVGCLEANAKITFVDCNGFTSPARRKTIAELHRAWETGERNGHAPDPVALERALDHVQNGRSMRSAARESGIGRNALIRHAGTHRPHGFRDERGRVRNMRLRVMDEVTGEFAEGRIADVIASGVKPVYDVFLTDGKRLAMTADHRVLTTEGWCTLRDAVGLTGDRHDATTTRPCELMVNGVPLHRDADWLRTQRDAGAGVDEMATAANCSYHTIRKWLRVHGLQFRPEERRFERGHEPWNKGQPGYTIRSGLTDAGRAAIGASRSGARSNFWRGGTSPQRAVNAAWATARASRVHSQYDYTCQRCLSRGGRLHVHHIVPVWRDASLAREIGNLITLCGACHRAVHADEASEVAFMERYAHRVGFAQDVRITGRHGFRLRAHPVAVERVVYRGDEETFDLCVEGPWHNFVANGIVVHNSFNELSGRYTELPDAFYVPAPEDVRTQVGKPGAYTFETVDDEAAERTRGRMSDAYAAAYATYRSLLDEGVAKEVARAVLPVGIYTEFWWTLNARSVMHFLGLRNAETAQREIRRYAEAVEELFSTRMPVTHAAFVARGRLAP